jgi:hypothetical protein
MSGSFKSINSIIISTQALEASAAGVKDPSIAGALLEQDELSAAVTLKFVRDVGNAAFVEAMVSSFADCKDQVRIVLNFQMAL